MDYHNDPFARRVSRREFSNSLGETIKLFAAPGGQQEYRKAKQINLCRFLSAFKFNEFLQLLN